MSKDEWQGPSYELPEGGRPEFDRPVFDAPQWDSSLEPLDLELAPLPELGLPTPASPAVGGTPALPDAPHPSAAPVTPPPSPAPTPAPAPAAPASTPAPVVQARADESSAPDEPGAGADIPDEEDDDSLSLLFQEALGERPAGVRPRPAPAPLAGEASATVPPVLRPSVPDQVPDTQPTGRRPFEGFPARPQPSSGQGSISPLAVTAILAMLVFTFVGMIAANSSGREDSVSYESSEPYLPEDPAVEQAANPGGPDDIVSSTWWFTPPQGWLLDSMDNGITVRDEQGQRFTVHEGYPGTNDQTQACLDTVSGDEMAPLGTPKVTRATLAGRPAIRLAGEDWSMLCAVNSESGEVVAAYVPPLEDGTAAPWGKQVLEQVAKHWHWL